MIDTMKSYIIKRAEYANCTGQRERANIVQELLAQCRLVNVCMPIYYISIHTDALGVIDGIETESGSYEWSDDMLRFVKLKGGEQFVDM